VAVTAIANSRAVPANSNSVAIVWTSPIVPPVNNMAQAYRLLIELRQNGAGLGFPPSPAVGATVGISRIVSVAASERQHVNCAASTQRRFASMKLSIESGTSPNSTCRRRSSFAISLVTSRDHPSAVLKATMRTGLEY
jgi:hypothetical protein